MAIDRSRAPGAVVEVDPPRCWKGNAGWRMSCGGLGRRLRRPAHGGLKAAEIESALVSRVAVRGGSAARVCARRVVWSRPSLGGRDRTRARTRCTGRRLRSYTMAARYRSPVRGVAAGPVPVEAGFLAGPADRFPLVGKLYCRCGARFFPAWSVASAREYRSACGCRLRPIDAATVEQRVVVGETAGNPLPLTERAPIDPTELIGRFCQRIEVGGTVEQIGFVVRP